MAGHDGPFKEVVNVQNLGSNCNWLLKLTISLWSICVFNCMSDHSETRVCAIEISTCTQLLLERLLTLPKLFCSIYNIHIAWLPSRKN